MPDDWGVLVNEVGILASGIGADRWVEFCIRRQERGMTCLGLTPSGGRWHVMTESREAADEAHALFLEVGFHKGHVKVARLSACQRAERRRRERVLAKLGEAPAAKASPARTRPAGELQEGYGSDRKGRSASRGHDGPPGGVLRLPRSRR